MTRPDQICALNTIRKKLLFVALQDSSCNYGNSLQHYASQKILEMLGFDVDILLCTVDVSKNSSATDTDTRIKALRKIQAQNDSLRKKVFEAFYDELVDNKIVSTHQEIIQSYKSLWNKYAYAVVGSDMVWSKNLLASDELLSFYYLPFIEPRKRVNYAPSFGVREFTTSELPVHKMGLEGFSRLSCREKSGCNLILNLTGRHAKHVLDTTLLFKADDWKKISRKPSYELPKHYALFYTFGVFPEEIEDTINNITGGMEIINIRNVKGKEYFCTDPREFIWLVDNADYVFTNSFHGIAFSVNFRKNFFAVATNKTWFQTHGSRIEDLLSTFNITDNVFIGADKKIPSVSVNYDEVHEKLNTMRGNSMKYLRECLKV